MPASEAGLLRSPLQEKLSAVPDPDGAKKVPVAPGQAA